MNYSPALHTGAAAGWEQQNCNSAALAAGSPEHLAAHQRLFELATSLDSDFEPYGRRSRETDGGPDCGCGCRHYAILEGVLGADWGVCMNRNSPRAGMLTFEHQGCRAFEETGPDPGEF